MLLFDILKAVGASAEQDFSVDQHKLHLAVRNGIEDPLDVYLRGDFEEWQSWQTRKNFERPFVAALIQLPPRDRWLFAGCFALHGCTPRPDGGYTYQTTREEAVDELTGRLVVRFPRPSRQSYLNAERWAHSIVVHELRPDRMTVEAFPGFRNVAVSKSKLDLIVSHNVESWRAALSSVAGVYVITDTATGRMYVGSATGEGGIWSRWVAYQQTGHGGNRDLGLVLSEKGLEYAGNFQFAILETADTRADADTIVARESHWKQVLDTRLHGYNSN